MHSSKTLKFISSYLMSSFSSLNEEGKSFVSKQDWSSAFLVFTKLITLEGISTHEKAIAHCNRSFVLLNMTKFENSKQDALKAIQSNPKWFKGYLRAGNAFLALKDIDGALKYFKEGFDKEEEKGHLRKMYSEVYFNLKFQARIKPSHKYYEVFQHFKENFFFNKEKSMKIFQNLRSISKREANIVGVCAEMHEIILDNLDYRMKVREKIKESDFGNANLCLWVLYQKEKDKVAKAKLFDEMIANYEQEGMFFPKYTIKYYASTTPAPQKKYSIHLNDVVELFWNHMHTHPHFENTTSQKYFIREVRSAGKELILHSCSPAREPDKFYSGANAEMSRNYYWKLFTMNCCSLINGCLATVLDSLLKQGIVPYLSLKENNEIERIDIVLPTIMHLIVKKDFINPWIYHNDLDLWCPLGKGMLIDESYLNVPSGHAVSVLITRKIVNNQHLSFFFDLTAPQFDIYEMTSTGYPCFKKPMFSSEVQNEEFIYGKVAATAQIYNDFQFCGNKENFNHFPQEVCVEVEKKTVESVKRFLKI